MSLTRHHESELTKLLKSNAKFCEQTLGMSSLRTTLLEHKAADVLHFQGDSLATPSVRSSDTLAQVLQTFAEHPKVPSLALVLAGQKSEDSISARDVAGFVDLKLVLQGLLRGARPWLLDKVNSMSCLHCPNTRQCLLMHLLRACVPSTYLHQSAVMRQREQKSIRRRLWITWPCHTARAYLVE